MFQAFFDASRTQAQTGAYVIAGYVSPEVFWKDFATEWHANLAYWQVEDFHLTECLAQRGAFERLDSHKAGLCAKSFGQIILQQKPEAMWSGLIDEDWVQLEASAAFVARYPSPYQFLFQDILWQLARWGRGWARGEMIAPIFDTDVDPESVTPIYNGLRESPVYDNLVPSVTFGSRRKYLPLQAADLFAGEMQRHWYEREYPRDPSILFPDWRDLLIYATPLGNTGGLWQPDTLKRAAEAFDRSGDPFNWD